jgi:hypothetical protein
VLKVTEENLESQAFERRFMATEERSRASNLFCSGAVGTEAEASVMD